MKTKQLPNHQCDLLKYHNRYLEHCVTSTNARWRLIIPKRTGKEEMVVLDNVLFCPSCGEDLRKSTIGCVAGRPKLEAMLAGAQKP